jgi:plastocyanin domain-containing protein
MKNKTAIIGIGMIVLVAAVFVFTNSGSATTGNVIANENVQIVKLSVEGGNYILSPSTIKKDTPVRIEADISKMPGCSKSVVISAFNIRKSLSSSDNVIEFTPNKAGTFNIACSMNMYQGSFTVLENDGTKPAYVEQKTQTGSSCGMANGGGCGCGG